MAWFEEGEGSSVDRVCGAWFCHLGPWKSQPFLTSLGVPSSCPEPDSHM